MQTKPRMSLSSHPPVHRPRGNSALRIPGLISWICDPLPFRWLAQLPLSRLSYLWVSATPGRTVLYMRHRQIHCSTAHAIHQLHLPEPYEILVAVHFAAAFFSSISQNKRTAQ